jgi:hypothetical protein
MQAAQKRKKVWLMRKHTGLYTDESPGLKVDPFVVMVLSIGFIISVVALHSESISVLARFKGTRC